MCKVSIPLPTPLKVQPKPNVGDEIFPFYRFILVVWIYKAGMKNELGLKAPLTKTFIFSKIAQQLNLHWLDLSLLCREVLCNNMTWAETSGPWIQTSISDVFAWTNWPQASESSCHDCSHCLFTHEKYNSCGLEEEEVVDEAFNMFSDGNLKDLKWVYPRSSGQEVSSSCSNHILLQSRMTTTLHPTMFTKLLDLSPIHQAVYH